jgi:predicted Zn finger-like uncharacterized protein
LIIVCNSCSTQYSVNDAKVRGKLVRITCKHCASAIVVDGRQMSEVSVAATTQKPLASYALPRRDESVVAHAPVPSAVPSRPHAPAPAPVPSVMSESMREDDRTMVARSKFVDDMSVHDERTVIGQIPKEALEFERMFAQRTQPPPPEPPKGQASTSPPPAAPVPASPQLPSFADEKSEDAEAQGQPEGSDESAQDAENAQDAPDSQDAPKRALDEDDEEDATKNVPVQIFSQSEPPTMGNKPTSDSRGLVSLAEATHPSVARSISARRVRVTVIALLVLVALVLLFVIQMPR